MTLSFPSPETITRTELPNGITVLVYENHSSPSVIVSGYLWAGSQSEAAQQAGLSSFTSGSLMRGTENYTFRQINEALESTGAQLGFHSAVHTVGFGAKSLVEDLDLVLKILAESLQRPTFPTEEVEMLQGQILTSLQRRAHDTRRMAVLTFDALLYPDHPYGRSILGYEETVSGLDRNDLAVYYREHYTPDGMVVALVGAVSTEDVLDKIRATLGDWRASTAAPNRSIPPSVRLDELVRQVEIMEGKTQSDIMLGWPGVARSDPDFMKVYLANTVLGVFGMMGRLGKQVRDKQGLAYYVYSSVSAGLGAGPWAAIAGVGPENVDGAISGILGEVRRLRDEPLPASDLSDSQSYLTGSLPLRLETNEGVAATLLDMERYALGLDYLHRYPGLVNSVTPQDVQDMVQKYLDPEVYALAIAGPGHNG